MAITESTIEVLVTRVDAQTGPVGGYTVTAQYQTEDSTTHLGGKGDVREIVFWMASGQPAVADLLDVHILAS